MDSYVSIQLIFLCVVNIISIFFGIVLNTLVIASFWKSTQLRKKLCHFMIMVLSCFDLISIVAIHPAVPLYLISWLREDYNLLRMMSIYLNFVYGLLGFSFFTLLVMNIERYLGAYYPTFHHTSVTRRRLLTLLATLLITTIVMQIIFGYSLVISKPVFLMIFMALFLPPFMFVNFKLFIIARKVHRERTVSPGKRTTMNLKNISTALWAVACTLLLSIPIGFDIAFELAGKFTNTNLSYMWSFTCVAINCTLNSLIFFWKNKVLRTEGIKILKTLKYCLVGS